MLVYHHDFPLALAPFFRRFGYLNLILVGESQWMHIEYAWLMDG